MQDYFFTFGVGQEHAYQYVRITASDFSTARNIMFNKYGEEWAFQYGSLEEVHPSDRNELEHLIEED